MWQIAIMTLALAGGDCPEPSHPRPLIPCLGYCPGCYLSCAGQKCASCARPLYPGAQPYDYRRQFNYPWSQAPCALRPRLAHAMPAGAPVEESEIESLPAPPQIEEVPAVETRSEKHDATTMRFVRVTSSKLQPAKATVR